MTRVVAATAEGTAKVIISYVREALSTKESQLDEPWKSSDKGEDAADETASIGVASTASCLWMECDATPCDSAGPG